MTTPFSVGDASALQSLQHGPHAYHCPRGHGALKVRPDGRFETGLSLVCADCGHQVPVDFALVGKAVTESLALQPVQGTSVRLFDGRTPIGLLPDGTVRTTGWVQLWRLPVSSGLWALLAGFWLTLPIGLNGISLAPLIGAVLGYALWRMWTLLLRPSSRAVNLGLVPASELAGGELVRVYGSAGPVGQVAAVAANATGTVLVRLVGGQEFGVAPQRRVWQAELRS
ncbi:hypothetical protein GCM10010174_86010 [Kutzneria viridogrisea]|uniref:Uncharacterized protein n=2 Tax=Kutzneria TaxID=43356 RepID=W5WL32_9PSEU|nr:hypothetical protein [Kutzneria albida]AHI01924.1 hypothetical protein KALB_8567 [Kutzneria albida DSM 43870]MBA8929654.1 hypothetical protein [Kutzneria viridogrisea]